MLTIEELTSRSFTTTRLREGYEISDVDAFVTEVRDTLARQERELRDLRRRLVSAEAAVDSDGDPVRESSMAAARLLEMATVNAEQLVAEARAEARSLLAAANADADQVAAAARTEAERVSAELEKHRETVLAEVAGRKAGLEADVEDLRRLERENRERLRGWFTELLGQVQEDNPHPVPLD